MPYLLNVLFIIWIGEAIQKKDILQIILCVISWPIYFYLCNKIRKYIALTVYDVKSGVQRDKNHKGAKTIILYDLLSVVSTILGAFILYYTIILNQEALRITKWNSCPCVIENFDYRNNMTKTHFYAYVYPAYQYEYNGRIYKGTRYRSVTNVIYTRNLNAIRQQYQPGKTAVCFINPNNPTQSVLIKHIDRIIIEDLLMHYLISIVCFSPIIMMINSRLRKRSNNVLT